MNNPSPRTMRYGLNALVSFALLAYGGSASAQAISASNPFMKGDLVVSRVGTGSTALSSASTAVFLDEYTTSGKLAGTVALPTLAVTGGNNPFTTSGTASSEGGLSLSADGTELLLAGYDAAPGVASISGTTAGPTSTSGDYPREVAVINPIGAVDDTTTLGGDFSANNPRGAAAPGMNAGVTIYAAGASTPGLVSTTMDTSGNGTNAETGFTNVQDVSDDNVAGSTNLYFSTRSGTTKGIYEDASPGASSVPTLIATDSIAVTGTGAGSGNPYAFYFTPDGSYLYVADTGSATTGAILKYSATTPGSAYAFDYALTQATTADAGIKGITGLTGVTTGTGTSENTLLYGVDPTTLFSVADSGTGTAFGTYSSLATAGANEGFRGVELSPTPEPSQVGMMALMGLGLGGLILRAKKKQSAA